MTPQLPMQDTPEVLSYRAAAHAFDTDPVAQRLLADLRDSRSASAGSSNQG